MEQGEIGAALDGLRGYLSGQPVAAEWMQTYGKLVGGRGPSTARGGVQRGPFDLQELYNDPTVELAEGYGLQKDLAKQIGSLLAGLRDSGAWTLGGNAAGAGLGGASVTVNNDNRKIINIATMNVAAADPKEWTIRGFGDNSYAFQGP